MRKVLTAALAVMAMAAAMAATSADARDWHDRGGHDHDGWRGHDHDRVGLRGHDGWGGGRFYGPPAYFAGADFWGYDGGCRTHWRWDGRWGRYVRVVSCY